MNSLETKLRSIFVKLHGEGAPHQPDFYRCTVCGRLVTWKKINAANLCCSGRLVPVNPTWFEVIRLFIFPWTI